MTDSPYDHQAVYGPMDWAHDVCICEGEPTREIRGALVLTVCSKCGKASREKAPRAYGNPKARRESSQ